MSKTRLEPKSFIVSALLFFIVFGLWQAYYLVLISFPISTWHNYLFYAVISGACLGTFAIFVKLERSSFKEHGYKQPIKTEKCVVLSLFFVAFYIFVTLTPGFMGRFESPPFSRTVFYFTFSILDAVLLTGLTTESIFRGYIFKNLTKNHGFFTALYASSLMFGLYQVSIYNLLQMSMDRITTYIFTDILPALAAGLFLGFFFYKTNWSLLGPIIFRVGIFLYLSFPPIMATPSWWVKLTSELIAYMCLILIVDSVIKEPRYRKRRYGLED